MVAYEGTRYHGWQIQPNQPSVQAALEQAYFAMTGLRTSMQAAGRTDCGVHALGQVVGFENPSRHDPDTLLRGLNAWLPQDISVRFAQAAPDLFDPRRHAVGKHYQYRIDNRPIRPVFERALSWHIAKKLDIARMNSAVKNLLGEHDFSAFRASGCEAKSPVRRIDYADWVFEPPLLQFDVFGNGFLKQMVRNIVGTCVAAGRGRLPPHQIKAVLDARDRKLAGPTSPAKGLFLVEVFYDHDIYRDAFARMKRSGTITTNGTS